MVLLGYAQSFFHSLLTPLLLFFYLGFLIPILRVSFEFPYVIYQGLTMYLLIAIGWHGGEELAALSLSSIKQVLGFMSLGFLTNLCLGFVAYYWLRYTTRLRKIDAATVAGYYGSDSAGTFVTAVAVLTTAGIAFEQYMPVLLAVMEIPGCLVALYLVSRLRHRGLDAHGNASNEPGFKHPELSLNKEIGRKLELEISLEKIEGKNLETEYEFDILKIKKLLHEIFLNPGIYLLFGGIIIGFISQGQNTKTVEVAHTLFVTMFQGILCFFLFDMGIVASKRLHDLKNVGYGFIIFALLAPNLFAVTGILLVHAYSLIFGIQLALGTYILFGILCGSASYIAVPAVQRLAIPEASAILPLAASLGLTFSYNVTIGIPLYILFAKYITS